MERTLRLKVIFLLGVLLTQVKGQSSSDEQVQDRAIIAHGVLMGTAFGFLFPVGATIMHVFKFRGFVWFHAGWQVFAYVLALAGLGLGVWIASVTEQLSASNGHPIIGIIVVGVLVVQPFGGWLAHSLNREKKHNTTLNYLHRWIGRIFLILGAINGGLGLQLSANTVKGEIAYGIVTGVFFLLWFGTWFFDRYRTQH